MSSSTERAKSTFLTCFSVNRISLISTKRILVKRTSTKKQNKRIRGSISLYFCSMERQVLVNQLWQELSQINAGIKQKKSMLQTWGVAINLLNWSETRFQQMLTSAREDTRLRRNLYVWSLMNLMVRSVAEDIRTKGYSKSPILSKNAWKSRFKSLKWLRWMKRGLIRLKNQNERQKRTFRRYWDR